MSFRKLVPWLVVVALAAASPLLLSGVRGRSDRLPGPAKGGGPYPSDWFGLQRAFPGIDIPQDKFRAAVDQARFDRVSDAFTVQGATLEWTQAGPFNIGGRVTALVATPGGATVYLASANGGVFKSVNAGVNWTPIFDQLGVFSIGALALEPGDSNVVYVGTGESNSSVDSYDGAGVFRTSDGGATWESLGLEATARIGAVEVDPQNTDRIYVAAMGRQFSTGPDRGLYRSEDRGATWQKVLFVNDSTGVADVVINPAHPETVYCATWERVRRPTYRRAYGPGCGVWRSVDHGTTWTRLSGGLPAPSDDVGRIGLAIAPSRPSTVYAQIVTGASLGYTGYAFYRSFDGGENWIAGGGGTYTGNFGGFGWYFGETVVDPTNPDRVFSLGLNVLRSTNSGSSFINATGPTHVDQHALWIDPINVSRMYQGNDGGFYYTTNGGGNWFKSVDLPITQFYAGTIDPSNPRRLLGGTQDNNTLLTDSLATNWRSILGGDGFQCLVDPTNPSILFAEWQNCCSGAGLQRSTTNGAGWTPGSGLNAPTERYNWNTPIAMDPTNHNILLVGSQRVHKSTNNGVSYVPVSGDLTTNPGAQLVYGTLTTLAISEANPAIYYAGTDDGKVWRSLNSGSNWTDITAGLPLRYVTRVTPDPLDAQVVYVTLSGFGNDEHLAHVYRSANQGGTWTSISGNLPDVPANDLIVDPVDTRTLYLATDVGVYATVNGGAAWFPFGEGMPIQTVFDLTFHAPSRTMVAATHGRSQWKMVIPAPLAVADRASPPRLSIASAAPNPSRGDVRVELELSRATALEVVIYDLAGRRVRTLLRERVEAGRQALIWNGADDRGRPTGAGVFFVRANASGAAATRRLIRTR